MELKELVKLLKVLKKHGVKHIKMVGVELSLDLDHDTAPTKPLESPSLPDSDPIDPFSDEDILNWSSGQA